MDAVAVITIVESLEEVLTQLIPEVEALHKNGQITDEQQAALLTAYKSLETRAAGQFTGPEWEIPTEPTPPISS